MGYGVHCPVSDQLLSWVSPFSLSRTPPSSFYRSLSLSQHSNLLSLYSTLFHPPSLPHPTSYLRSSHYFTSTLLHSLLLAHLILSGLSLSTFPGLENLFWPTSPFLVHVTLSSSCHHLSPLPLLFTLSPFSPSLTLSPSLSSHYFCPIIIINHPLSLTTITLSLSLTVLYIILDNNTCIWSRVLFWAFMWSCLHLNMICDIILLIFIFIIRTHARTRAHTWPSSLGESIAWVSV